MENYRLKNDKASTCVLLQKETRVTFEEYLKSCSENFDFLQDTVEKTKEFIFSGKINEPWGPQPAYEDKKYFEEEKIPLPVKSPIQAFPQALAKVSFMEKSLTISPFPTNKDINIEKPKIEIKKIIKNPLEEKESLLNPMPSLKSESLFSSNKNENYNTIPSPIPTQIRFDFDEFDSQLPEFDASHWNFLNLIPNDVEYNTDPFYKISHQAKNEYNPSFPEITNKAPSKYEYNPDISKKKLQIPDKYDNTHINKLFERPRPFKYENKPDSSNIESQMPNKNKYISDPFKNKIYPPNKYENDESFPQPSAYLPPPKHEKIEWETTLSANPFVKNTSNSIKNPDNEKNLKILNPPSPIREKKLSNPFIKSDNYSSFTEQYKYLAKKDSPDKKIIPGSNSEFLKNYEKKDLDYELPTFKTPLNPFRDSPSLFSSKNDLKGKQLISTDKDLRFENYMKNYKNKYKRNVEGEGEGEVPNYLKPNPLNDYSILNRNPFNKNYRSPYNYLSSDYKSIYDSHSDEELTYENLVELEYELYEKGNGFDSKILKKLKIEEYVGEDQEICTICQCEFIKKEKISVLKCGHLFHYACVKDWLQRKKRCPMSCELDSKDLNR